MQPLTKENHLLSHWKSTSFFIHPALIRALAHSTVQQHQGEFISKSFRSRWTKRTGHPSTTQDTEVQLSITTFATLFVFRPSLYYRETYITICSWTTYVLSHTHTHTHNLHTLTSPSENPPETFDCHRCVHWQEGRRKPSAASQLTLFLIALDGFFVFLYTH